MLVVKSILKVIGEVVGITLVLALLLALFLGSCWVIMFVLGWMDVVLATILGLAKWEAVKVVIGNIFLTLLVICCIVGVVALFALEVREEYLREKRRKEEGWE